MLSEVKPNGKNALIGAICDIMLDHYVSGFCRNISRETTVPILEGVDHEWFLGGGGNLIQNLALSKRLHKTCAVIGKSRSDQTVLQLLESSSIDRHCLVEVPYPYVSTHVKYLGAPFGGRITELLRVDDFRKVQLDESALYELKNSLRRMVKSCDVVVASAYLPEEQSCLTRDVRRLFVEECKVEQKVSISACRSDPVLFSGTDYIVLNELELLCCLKKPMVEIKEVEIFELTREFGIMHANLGLVITLGERGAVLWNRISDKCTKINTQPLPPGTDPTGAGDVFLAAFSCSIAMGLSPEEACSVGVNSATEALKSHRRPALTNKGDAYG